MSSSPSSNGGRIQIPVDSEIPFSPPIRHSSRRTRSFSSTLSLSSSSLSSNSSTGSVPDSPCFSPPTPLRPTGIPFSWEKTPGIPKKQRSRKMNPSRNLLPLPPSGSSFSSKDQHSFHEIPQTQIKNFSASDRFRKDPFFAALMECSKNDGSDDDLESQHGNGNLLKLSKVSRTLSDRFGLISIYTSCRRSCPVSQSTIQLPRSYKHDILGRRST